MRHCSVLNGMPALGDEDVRQARSHWMGLIARLMGKCRSKDSVAYEGDRCAHAVAEALGRIALVLNSME